MLKYPSSLRYFALTNIWKIPQYTDKMRAIPWKSNELIVWSNLFCCFINLRCKDHRIKSLLVCSQQQHNSTQHQLGAWILWPRIFVLCRRSLLLRLVLGLRSGVEEISEVVGEVLKNSRYNKFHRLIYWAHLVQQLASLGVHVAAGVGVEHLNSINYFENFYP